LELRNDLVHLMEVTILPSGSVYFAIRGNKEWKNGLNKAFLLMHSEKVSYLLILEVIYLEKYPKI